MKIAQNIPALLSNRQLTRSAGKIEKSSVRLSSGIKLQGSEDDPASYAISKKMKQQIAGLMRANQNALDGISLIQTADGALAEAGEIVQRIRELSIQSSNDTLTPEDRDKINAEVKNLVDEVDRISKTTEFNGVNLLGGDLSRLTYVPKADYNMLTDPRITDSVESGDYSFMVDAIGMPAVAYGSNSGAIAVFSTSGSITINREEILISAGETRESVMSKINEVCSRSDMSVYNASSIGFDLRFATNEAGSQYEINITGSNAALLAELGLNSVTTYKGKDAELSNLSFINADGEAIANFPSNSSVSASGNRITISSLEAREIDFDLKVNVDLSTYPPYALWGDRPVSLSYNSVNEVKTLHVRDEGDLRLQVGPDRFMDLSVQIPEMSAHNLGLDRVSLGTLGDSQLAISYCEEALSKVLGVRSKLGAYENRLNYTVKSLEIAEYNTTTSLSIIIDTDMAKEMTEYSAQNVIQQAAIAIIAQANARPQQLLQLLQ